MSHADGLRDVRNKLQRAADGDGLGPRGCQSLADELDRLLEPLLLAEEMARIRRKLLWLAPRSP